MPCGRRSAAAPPPATIEFGGPERHVSVTIGADSPINATRRTSPGHPPRRIRLGHGEHAKQTVYTTWLRHLVTDLLAAIDNGRPPRIDLDAATAAVARRRRRATEAARTGRTLRLARSEH